MADAPASRTTKTVLISGANGDTGRPAVRESIALGLAVRALVHSVDERAKALADLGAEVVEGDLLDINTVRRAMEGVDAAYFVWPVQPGLLHAIVNFGQAAKEAGVGTVINLSQRSADRWSTSDSCRDSFIGEQVLNWSGLDVVHLRPTYFWSGCSIRGSCPICSAASCACPSARVGTHQSPRTTKAARSPRSC